MYEIAKQQQRTPYDSDPYAEDSEQYRGASRGSEDGQ